MIRKFYETEAPVATGGGGVNIAALMAQHGVVNNSDSPVATQIDIPEKKEETTTTETAPAATANTETKVESTNSETLSPEVKTEQAATTQTAIQPTPEKPWQEVLKSQQPDLVLKELGIDNNMVSLVKELDPKVIGFIQAYKEGKHLDFVKEWTTDYKAMPAEEVMRHQLRQEYPTASEAQLDALYKREIVKAYNLDSEDEEEVNEGKLLLDAKADRYRAELLKNQETKLLPTAPAAKAAEIDPVEVQREETLRQVTTQFNESSYTKNIIATNQLVVGEGDDKFTFPIDARAITDLAVNGDTSGETLFNKTVDENGRESYSPNVEKQILLATVQKYGMDFINALVTHAKGAGSKKVVDSIENASDAPQDNSSRSESQPTSAAAAMAKGGVINSGGYNR